MWHSALLASLLFLLSTTAYADVDKALQKSLHSFFAHGVYSEGASAEFVEVLRWPDTTGAVRWRMPRLSNHPSRISLIAERGKGKNQRRWYVPVRLRWWTQAVVTSTELPVRTLLTKAMLKQMHVDVAGHLGSWWKDTDNLVGTRLTRPLKANQVIYTPYVKRPRLLRRGDQVTMIAKFGGLTVKATGKMMRSAGLSERVQVQNIKSKQTMQAIVVDGSTVRVVTGGRG